MLLYVDSQYISPYAMSVFVALHEKGLPFEMVTVNLSAGEQNAANFANKSLTKRVPTMVDGDFTLSESSAITEYLDETYRVNALYPAAAKDRARARQIQAWLRSDLMPIRLERSSEVLFLQPTTKPLSELAKLATKKLYTAAQALLSHKQPNLFNTWCIADFDLALMLNRLALNGDDIPSELAAYAKHQWQRPSVQLWLNQTRA